MQTHTRDRSRTGDRTRARDGWAVRLLPLWCLGAGFVVGGAAGGLARYWMRLIATERPEFTWSGTLFIVGVFAVAGAMVGPVVGARRRGWTGGPMAGLRMVGCAATLPLCLGQGAVLAPTLVFGTLAVARRTWPGWVRAVLGLVAALPFAAVHLLLLGDWSHSWVRLVAAVAVAGAVYGGAVLALAKAYAPAPGARLRGDRGQGRRPPFWQSPARTGRGRSEAPAGSAHRRWRPGPHEEPPVGGNGISG